MPPTKAQYAKIHIAVKALGLDDEEYRDILHHRFQVRSSRELTERQAEALLLVFRTAGWNPAPRAMPGRKAAPPVSREDAQGRMIRGLWITLAKAGAVADGSERALNRYIKRMVRIDALRFCTPGHKSRLIEHLKSWEKRDMNELAGCLLPWLDIEPYDTGRIVWRAR
ncbi:MAG: regulatory protein GemA [Thermodesulfobacteriota bacterium]